MGQHLAEIQSLKDELLTMKDKYQKAQAFEAEVERLKQNLQKVTGNLSSGAAVG